MAQPRSLARYPRTTPDRSTARTVARLAMGGPASTARALALTDTTIPPGTSRTRRRTSTTAWTAEQSHRTSSAPLARATAAARKLRSPHASPLASGSPGPCPGHTAETPPRPCSGRPASAPTGASAASAARSAAVCATALAAASAPTSTPTSPTSSTNPASANPTRVAPPSSPGVMPPPPPRSPLLPRHEDGRPLPGEVASAPSLKVAPPSPGSWPDPLFQVALAPPGSVAGGLTGRRGPGVGRARGWRRRWP
jgi:hypothetical protein